MSNNSLNTNGATLESCHTNVFTLTELSGLQWKRFVVQGEGVADGGSFRRSENTYLKDPILISYGRCLNANLLAAWKRAPSQTGTWPHGSSTGATLKSRLWIFWYGEEQPDLSQLLSVELSEEDSGGWENGLSYECRVLLFRAIHTLIERCLLAHRYVRVGRWFVEPHDVDRQISDQTSLRYSYAFDFFLHGESTVCTTVDVRLHPQLIRLNKAHLTRFAELYNDSNNYDSPLPVAILGPYGLAGSVTGKCAPAEKARELLRQWKCFFPFTSSYLPQSGSSGHLPSYHGSDSHPSANTPGPSPNDLSAPSPAPDTPNPQMAAAPTDNRREETFFVEVLVGSVRMFYPSDFVSLVDDPKLAHLHLFSTGVIPQFTGGTPANTGVEVFSLAKQYLKSTQISSSFKRSGFCGVPELQEYHAASYLENIVTSSFRDVSHKERRKSVSDGSPQKLIDTCLAPEILDSAERKQCDCDGCRNVLEFGAPRSTSPVSSPPSYSAQGLGLMALKVKAAQEQPNHSVDPNRAQNTFPFHKRILSFSNLSETLTRQTSLSPSKKSNPYSTSRTNLPRNARQPVFSPGSSFPKTPQSQLGSVPQMSPVSSPASISVSVTSPFNPRTPKTPRSSILKSDVPPPVWPPPKSQTESRSVEDVELPAVAVQTASLKTSRPVLDAWIGSEEDSNESECDNPVDTDWAAIRVFKRLKPNFSSVHAPEVMDVVLSALDERTNAKAVTVNLNGDSGRVGVEKADVSVGTTVKTSASNQMEEPRFSKHLPGPGMQDLSKMFPTPPSIENYPVSSPLCELINPNENSSSYHESEDQSPSSVEDKVPTSVSNLNFSSKYSALRTLNGGSNVGDQSLAYRPSWLIMPKFQHASRREVPRMPVGRPRQKAVERSSSVTFDHKMVPQMRPPGNPMQAGVDPKMRNAMLDLLQSHQANQPSPLVHPPVSHPDQEVLLPECHSLLVNLLMSDSLLNSFTDKNFAGCSICVCNMSIHGRDSVQNPIDGPPVEEHQFSCVCGFSAAENKRFSSNAGLFDEDEVEVIGSVSDTPQVQLLSRLLDLNSLTLDQESTFNKVPDSLVDFLKYSVSNPFLTASSLQPSSLMQQRNNLNLEQRRQAGYWLQHVYMNQICMGVIGLCRSISEGGAHRLEERELLARGPRLHDWLLGGQFIRTNSDVLQVQRQIQPLLQEAIQLRRQTRLWDKVFTVEGPLTWKDFLKAVDKDVMEQQKEPLPIPWLCVGFEKEWLKVPPLAFANWERLNLEPYASKRDVVYVVLAPEGTHLQQPIKAFFRDLSKAYELCLLGRHLPMPKLTEGVAVAYPRNISVGNADTMDDWFRLVGDSPLANKLRIYASTCRHFLGPHISGQINEGNVSNLFLPPPPPPVRALPEGQSADTAATVATTESIKPPAPYDYNANGLSNHMLTLTLPHYPFDAGYVEKDEAQPLIVVYLVDPFTYNSKFDALYRLCCIGLLRSFQELLKSLPSELHERIVPQFVPLQTILEQNFSDGLAQRTNALRSLAFSIYSQNLRSLSWRQPTKMLTGFGPATALKRWMEERKTGASADDKAFSMATFNPPYILASRKDRMSEITECMSSEGKDKTCSLFVSYCLSEDRRFILISCTDENGEIIETQVINVTIPERAKRKQFSLIRYGLRRLWEFLLGVIAKLTGPCRLVIGRVGRLGHGELKVWSSLLSKKALNRAGHQFRQMCSQCKLMSNLELPNIVSACLISIQPESSLRITVDAFTHDERLPSHAASCLLSTPEEATCTHIYVFPTSATAQAQTLTGVHAEEHGDLFGSDLDIQLDIDQGAEQGVDGLDFSDLFGFPENITSPITSPKPGDMHNQPISPSNNNKSTDPRAPLKDQDILDEPGQLQLQPLAAGYLVSTAPIGSMPQWFFAATEQDGTSCPVVLRSALHIHSANVLQGDDMYHSSASNTRNGHPLDSNLTADVLKHVLECYNALSWLVMDPASHDRRSCLPLHIQVLMQLYFAASNIL